MPKLVVEIVVSATGESVDFSLPDRISVEKLLILITEALNKHIKLKFSHRELALAHILTDQTCVLLPLQSTLYEEGVRDGAKLMLI